jgi:anti-sigma factor ChrR (cupin superfamily)
MDCVSPPELDDTCIWSYLDGEADLSVQAHVEQCPRCRQRAEQLAALQGRLMPAAQATAVTRHLAQCHHCTREIAQLQAFLTDLSPAQEPASEPGPLEQMRERVRVLIAQLSSAASPFGTIERPGLAPALAGIRGQEQTACRYQAGGVEVVIGSQPDDERPGRRAILGLITGLESTGVVANLWQGNQQIATAAVDELDTFYIPDVPPGSYELILTGPEVEILIQDLEVGARRD